MKDIKFYKLVVFVNALVPLALLAWDCARGQAGANPIDFVTRTTGTLTLVFLVLTLAVTPLRNASGVPGVSPFRLLAFFTIVPLAVTSTDKMIKRLGGKRWQKLHRLTYVSACAGVFHYYLLVKSATRKPLLFAAAVALLLGYRLFNSYTKGPKARPLSLTRPSPRWGGVGGGRRRGGKQKLPAHGGAGEPSTSLTRLRAAALSLVSGYAGTAGARSA